MLTPAALTDHLRFHSFTVHLVQFREPGTLTVIIEAEMSQTQLAAIVMRQLSDVRTVTVVLPGILHVVTEATPT